MYGEFSNESIYSTAPKTAKFDIRKLYQTQEKRNHYRQEMYDSVLRKVHCRIETIAARKESKCLFQIPSLLLGMPLYNPYECSGYVMQRLRADGFIVSHAQPNILYIDWTQHLIEPYVKQMEAHQQAVERKALSRAAYEENRKEKDMNRHSLGSLPTVTIPKMEYTSTGKLFQ